MSTYVKPAEQLEFRGVYTAGNPIQRPRGTAQSCVDFRVMPGNFLRLRSGRVAQYNTNGGSFLLFHPFRQVGTPGYDSQLVQVVFSGSPQWHWFSLSGYIVNTGTKIEDIATAQGGNAATEPVAVTNLIDRPLFYNGLGVRNASNSRPAFSSYTSAGVRYYGLDCYLPSGPLAGSFTTLDGGANQFQTSCEVYVGLYNSATNHYSNGVHLISLVPQGLGTVRAASLGNLTYATHGSSETAELYYVFYATIDGGEVPYLILNSTLDGPYKVAVSSSTAALSINATADNGWDLDLAHEMPTENFPPRPMRSIAFANGRVYGALMSGGADHSTYGDQPPFTYVPTSRELAAVCWSAAAGDSVETDFLGDPLQSFPLNNLEYTPSAEQPLAVAPAAEGTRAVLVLTASHAFYLSEQADGIHEWTTISPIHGIIKANTLRSTRYGMVWVDQRRQIMLLPPGSTSLQVLSIEYQSLLPVSATVRCADYILDPANLVDRYQVWLADGTSVCHDFMLQAPGQAYKATGQDYTAAASPIDSSGQVHHIVAKGGIYTHEGQPIGGGVPANDQTFSNTTNQTNAFTDISGSYTRNWDDFGDSDIRKELPILDLTGDSAIAVSPSGITPLTVEWYADFETVNNTNKKTVAGERIKQSTTIPSWRFRLTSANKFWYKLVFKLAGHAADLVGVTSNLYPSLDAEGDYAMNFYGLILRAGWRIGPSENRP